MVRWKCDSVSICLEKIATLQTSRGCSWMWIPGWHFHFRCTRQFFFCWVKVPVIRLPIKWALKEGRKLFWEKFVKGSDLVNFLQKKRDVEIGPTWEHLCWHLCGGSDFGRSVVSASISSSDTASATKKIVGNTDICSSILKKGSFPKPVWLLSFRSLWMCFF